MLEEAAKEHMFKDIDFDHLTSKSRGSEPEEIPELGKRYLSAIDEFLHIAPQDERIPVLLFHAAAIYYVYGHVEDALKRFRFIIDAYPKTQAAAVSARLVIDDAVTREDWPRVIALAEQFKAQGLTIDSKDFSKLQSNARFKIARMVFEDAAKLQKENQMADAKAKYKEAASLFLNLLKEDPKSTYADIMLFNVAQAAVESGKTTEALPFYRRLYTEYPQSEYAKVARFQEALALEKMLKFTEAAKAYDAIIKLDPKSETAANAMLNKALLYEAAEEFANAALAYTEFASTHPEREEAPDAILAAASLYKKLGKITQSISMLKQFVERYRKDKARTPAVIEAYVQIGDGYGELEKQAKTIKLAESDHKQQLESYRAAVSLYHPDLESAFAAYFAAKARLFLEKPEQEAFKKMFINARVGKGQADQMTAMLKRLTELVAKNENDKLRPMLSRCGTRKACVVLLHSMSIWQKPWLRRPVLEMLR